MVGDAAVSGELVPAIRFEGFSGEWEEKQIQGLIDEQSITSHLDGNHGELYPRANEFSDVGVPYIAANDFADGIVNFSGCKKLPINRANKFKKGIAINGDILFAHNATVGPVAKLSTEFDFVIISTTATYFRCDNKKLINNYLLQAFSHTRFIEQYSRVMSQSTRNQVPITAQRKFFIFIPKGSAEQTKIGQYFQQLDTLITQHQHKHDKLLNLKKSLLEKMFPKQGADEPAIRFKGFSGAWEEKALSEVTDVYDGTHQTPKYTSSGVMFLSVENIKTLKSKKYISQESFEKEFKVFPKKNDVLMTRIGDVGTANVVETDDPKAYYVTLALLKHKKLDPYYLKSCIASDKVKKDIWHRTLHIAFPKKINMNEIVRIKIPSPNSTNEQTKIGNLFQQLDTLITQHQTQLNKLTHIKQACLAKLFV